MSTGIKQNVLWLFLQLVIFTMKLTMTYRKIIRFISLFIALFGFGALWYLLKKMEPDLQKADAIIVLGCRVQPNGSPSNALAARTYLATHLYREGFSKNIVFTGGQGDFGDAEAKVAAALAQRTYKIPPTAIHLEDQSTSTTENAAGVAALNKFDSVIIVTNDYHRFRARRVFERHFEHVQVATIQTPTSSLFVPVIRELLAIGYYWFDGRL